MERQYEFVCDQSNGAISNDLEWPLEKYLMIQTSRGLSATAELFVN